MSWAFYARNLNVFVLGFPNFFLLLTACNKKEQIRCEDHCISQIFFDDNRYNCLSQTDEILNNPEEKRYFRDDCKFDISSTNNFKPIRISNTTRCKNNNCGEGYYKCYLQNYCISIELICNGISECFRGDDELDCRKSLQIN